MDEDMKDEIEKVIEIAKNGTIEEKESFVEYVCSAIAWLSSQGRTEELAQIETLYKAYLSEKKEDVTVQLLSEQSGKSKAAIYNLAKKLCRLPTLEEINSQKVGRPKKYF